jgi:hypothetical protein
MIVVRVLANNLGRRDDASCKSGSRGATQLGGGNHGNLDEGAWVKDRSQ